MPLGFRERIPVDALGAPLPDGYEVVVVVLAHLGCKICTCFVGKDIGNPLADGADTVEYTVGVKVAVEL